MGHLLYWERKTLDRGNPQASGRQAMDGIVEATESSRFGPDRRKTPDSPDSASIGVHSAASGTHSGPCGRHSKAPGMRSVSGGMDSVVRGIDSGSSGTHSAPMGVQSKRPGTKRGRSPLGIRARSEEKIFTAETRRAQR